MLIAWSNRGASDLPCYNAKCVPVITCVFDKTEESSFSYFVVDGITARNGMSVVAIRDP